MRDDSVAEVPHECPMGLSGGRVYWCRPEPALLILARRCPLDVMLRARPGHQPPRKGLKYRGKINHGVRMPVLGSSPSLTTGSIRSQMRTAGPGSRGLPKGQLIEGARRPNKPGMTRKIDPFSWTDPVGRPVDRGVPDRSRDPGPVDLPRRSAIYSGLEYRSAHPAFTGPGTKADRLGERRPLLGVFRSDHRII